MNNTAFAWITLGIGLTVSLVLLAFTAENSNMALHIPLLTILLMSEFCFIVNTAAAVSCARNLISQGFDKIQLFLLLGNLLLAVYLLFSGMKVWQGMSSQ